MVVRTAKQKFGIIGLIAGVVLMLWWSERKSRTHPIQFVLPPNPHTGESSELSVQSMQPVQSLQPPQSLIRDDLTNAERELQLYNSPEVMFAHSSKPNDAPLLFSRGHNPRPQLHSYPPVATVSGERCGAAIHPIAAVVDPVTAKKLNYRPVPKVRPTCYVEPDTYTELHAVMLHYRILRNRCHVRTSDEYCTGLTIDIGVHRGWYALYFATLGCDVIGIEPKPIHPPELFEYNGVKPYVDIKEVLIGSKPATFGRSDENVMKYTPDPVVRKAMGENGMPLVYHSVRLTDVVPTNRSILMLKMDIEGWEVVNFATIAQFIDRDPSAKLYNFIVEITPKWWFEATPKGKLSTDADKAAAVESGLDVIESFVDRYGYDVYVIYWGTRSRRLSDGEEPHNLAVETNWDTDLLRHVQRVPRAKLRAYIKSIETQIDFWFYLPESKGGLSLAGTGLERLEEVYCNAEEWGFAEEPKCWSYPKIKKPAYNMRSQQPYQPPPPPQQKKSAATRAFAASPIHVLFFLLFTSIAIAFQPIYYN